MNSALVLSGGGSLGMAHLGAVSVLLKKGYKFDCFVGVSAGAIMAAGFAVGKSVEEIEEQISIKKLFKLFFDFSVTDFGVIRGNKIWQFIDDFFQGISFKELKYPLYIAATDFVSGKQVILNTGSVAKAVRASLSVPVLFEPFYHQERWLVDGGLSQNFPLDIAINKYKGDKIIGIDLVSNIKMNVDFNERKFGQKIFRLREMLERTFRIIFKNQQKFPPDSRVEIIKPDLSDFTALSVNKLDQIKKIGEESIF
jgi:NTE family protein